MKGLGPHSTFILLNSSKDEGKTPPVVKKDNKQALKTLVGW